MAATEGETVPNGTGALSEEDERLKDRPADIDADVREMERRKRVEALMSSKLFREELERVLDQQLHDGGDAPLLQRIREMVGGRLHSGSFRGPSCVLPINDIRGIEGIGYEKGEKILRCKLAAAYRLVDLFGWTQSGIRGQITARLNTAVEQVLTTPWGILPHEVTASSLVKVDMQGNVVDQGTTNFPADVEGFAVHGMVHAARPDLRCVLHVRAPAALAVSATRQGLLPLCAEAALLGDIAYHPLPHGPLDNEEQEKLVRALGPHAKVLILTSAGALCCGATLEEAFYQARNLMAACEMQMRLAGVPPDQLLLLDEDARRQIYESSRKNPGEQQKWRVGGEEFEALMRMLDNAGFRTGYVYRHPLIKNDVPRPKNDVEVPPAVSSLGYLLEEEELYRQGIWKKGHGKVGERTRWLNSPNVYQRVEVLETGTTDPKKITKWVDANNEEWVQDGSPQHSSTPVKIDTLQFVPKNTNPKEFKKLQQLIKENRRADKISAGPQSHILEGVTWDEAAKLVGEDAANTATGDHVVLMGAASKGIIQRGYQHNATVYSAPYARNPFDRVSDSEIADYRRIVERKQRSDYDTDVSESEGLSGAQFTSPLSETEEESRDEHRVLRIETKQVPVRSQPEIVLSDDFLNAERAHADRIKGTLTQDPNTLTEALNSNQRSMHDYSRTTNFENAIKKFGSPDATNITITAPSNNATNINLDHSVSFARVRERFNSPDDFGNRTFGSKSSGNVANVKSPVYENVKKFESVSTGNIAKGAEVVHPKCKVSLNARLSNEGKSDLQTSDVKNYKNDEATATETQNDHVKNDCQLKFTFKDSSGLSGLAKLANELKNDAISLNSKIAIEALNSRLASEASSNSDARDSQSKGHSHHSKQGSEIYAYALDLYNPGNNSTRSSLYSIPSIDWDGRCRSDYALRTRSLPRHRPQTKEQRLYRTQSHSGFINSHIKDPEPTHFHLPRCNSCGATNVSYTWELIKEDLESIRSTGKRSIKLPKNDHVSVNDMPQKCLEEGSKVKVTKKVVPVYKVANIDDFVESQEFNEDNYFEDIGTSFSSDNQTVIEKVIHVNQDDTITEETVNLYVGGSNNVVADKTEVHQIGILDFGENCLGIKSTDDPKTDTECKTYESENDKFDNHNFEKYRMIENLEEKVDLSQVCNDDRNETQKDSTISTEGEYHSFSDEVDFDTMYVSPVKELVEKDIRDYSVPIGFYCDDYRKENDPIKSPKSPKRREVTPTSPLTGNILEPILEESKSSYSDDSSNLSNERRLSDDASFDKSKEESKTIIKLEQPILEIIKETVETTGETTLPPSEREPELSFNETDLNPQISIQLSSKQQLEPNGSKKEVFEPHSDDTREFSDANSLEYHKKMKVANMNDDVITDIGDKASTVYDINMLMQDIFTTAVTASILKTELSSSSQKVTLEQLHTECLHNNSYFIAEDDDLTANDVESVATCMIQTAVDAYSEEEDNETDQLTIVDYVYDNVFEILSQDAISAKVNAEPEKDSTVKCDIEEDTGENISVSDNGNNKEITEQNNELSTVAESQYEVYVRENEILENKTKNYTEVIEQHNELSTSTMSASLSKVDTREKTSVNEGLENQTGQNGRNDTEIIMNNYEHSTVAANQSKPTNDTISEDKSIFISIEKHVDTDSTFLKPENPTVAAAPILSDVLERKSLFEYSVASSGFELRSFDSTVEFEKYEAVSDVIYSILSMIDFEQGNCDIFQNLPKDRSICFDLNTSDDLSMITHITPNECDEEVVESVTKLTDDETKNIDYYPQTNENVQKPELNLQEIIDKEPANQEIESESSNSIVIEVPHDIIKLTTVLTVNISETNTENSKAEIQDDFSITKIVHDMEQNVNLNDTVLTDASETELSLAQKIGESLIYYIFDRAFCTLAEKKKLQRNKVAKTVITVAEAEDILLTAKSLWSSESFTDPSEVIPDIGNYQKNILCNDSSAPEKVDKTQNGDIPSGLSADESIDEVSKSDIQISATDTQASKSLGELETCLNNNNTEGVTSIDIREHDETINTTLPKVDMKFEIHVEGVEIDDDKLNSTNNHDRDTKELEIPFDKNSQTHCVVESERELEASIETSAVIHDENVTYEEDMGQDLTYGYERSSEIYCNNMETSKHVDAEHHNELDNPDISVPTWTVHNVSCEPLAEFSVYNEDLDKSFDFDTNNNQFDDSSNRGEEQNLSDNFNETYVKTTRNVNETLSRNDCDERLNYSENKDTSLGIAKEIVDDVLEKSLLDQCEPDWEHCNELIHHSDFDKTFILEKSSDCSMNTAFVVESPDNFYSRSSSPHKESSAFERCTESPIRNSKNSFEGDDLSVFYEKDDTILGSPFVKRAPVISMSQTQNTGGVKYWVSFDESLTESVDEPTYRCLRKFSENKVASFVAFDFKEENEEIPLAEKGSLRRNSVLLDDTVLSKSTDTNINTGDSYASAGVSSDYQTCESDFTDAKMNPNELQKKLLYDSRIDLHSRQVARLSKSWPPFDDSLYYKLVSTFRMTDSFDSKDIEDARFGNNSF